MTRLEELQQELFKLRKERLEITIEKGLIAEEEKDLRENGAYTIMEEKEHMHTSRIMLVTKEIEELTRKPGPKFVKSKKKEEDLYEFKPHKWF